MHFIGKLRSRNILPPSEVHGYRISKIVALNFSKSAWKLFKITAFEQRRPPSWRLGMISRLWHSIRQGFYCDDLNLTFNTLKYDSLPRCWLQQHIQKRQGEGWPFTNYLRMTIENNAGWLRSNVRGNYQSPGTVSFVPIILPPTTSSEIFKYFTFFYIYFAFSWNIKVWYFAFISFM